MGQCKSSHSKNRFRSYSCQSTLASTQLRRWSKSSDSAARVIMKPINRILSEVQERRKSSVSQNNEHGTGTVITPSTSPSPTSRQARSQSYPLPTRSRANSPIRVSVTAPPTIFQDVEAPPPSSSPTITTTGTIIPTTSTNGTRAPSPIALPSPSTPIKPGERSPSSSRLSPASRVSPKGASSSPRSPSAVKEGDRKDDQRDGRSKSVQVQSTSSRNNSSPRNNTLRRTQYESASKAETLFDLFSALEIDAIYCDVFRSQGINIRDLPTISEVDFFNMMPKIDQRIRLVQFINKHFPTEVNFYANHDSFRTRRALSNALSYHSDSGESSESIHVNSSDDSSSDEEFDDDRQRVGW